MRRPFFRRRRKLEVESEDFGIILAAALTLLGLIISFTFSMAVNRYDQRKNYEEAEANAIGTEYVRPTSCLPPMRRKYVRCLSNILINVSCPIRPAISSGLRR